MAEPTGRIAKVGIVVVAYNAAATLVNTLDRIPSEILPRLSEIIISDDASHDDTFDLAREWGARADMVRTTVVRHTKNLGYGGNQKAAYRIAIDHGLDIVVMLHGDGQYAPERLPDMLAPFQTGSADAVFGSRMMVQGAARLGGMPMYKWLGNRILTRFENAVLGTTLSEFHSGYRAYSTAMLARIPFEANSDGFDFDTQIIAQIVNAGGHIVEVPIPTYYGDEICYVDGLKYASDVVRDVVEFKLATKGFGTQEWVPTPEEYLFKEGDGSSHAAMLAMLPDHPARILDLGCSGGLFAERARAAGHHVTGVDYMELPGVRERTDRFLVVDLEQGIPEEVGDGYDVIVAGDIIEHLTRPVEVLKAIRRVLRPGGELLLSVPNFGHWYPRVRVATGMFGYDRRGILDNTHVRFFTRSTLRRAVRTAGFDILEESATGLPLGAVGATGSSGALNAVRRLDSRLVRLRPTLFGYQHVLRLTPHAEEAVYAVELKDATGSAHDDETFMRIIEEDRVRST